MKNIGLLSLVTSLMIFSACNKQGIADNTPKCIQDKIEVFQENKLCAEGANVQEYRFQGDFVYTFENGNCGTDLQTEVVSEDCNSLGFLGGTTGNEEINGEDFENAVFQRAIWED